MIPTRPKLHLHERLIVLLFCGIMLCLTLISLNGPDRTVTLETLETLPVAEAPAALGKKSTQKPLRTTRKSKKSTKNEGKDL